MMQSSEIHNFKQCNNKEIEYIGQTGVEEMSDEAKEQLKAMSKMLQSSCDLQNKAIANINEYTFKCFKNPQNSSYKYIVLKDNKLINIKRD